MTESLDIYWMPIYRQTGQDEPELPGLYLAEPPRRTARGRNQDRLILYLSTVGNAPLSPGKLDQLLQRLAQTYYKTPGSVTAALRTVAETLNNFMLDRNLRNASTGRQATGMLTLLVFREERLYMAQSGAVHAYVALSGQTQHLYDPQLSGRGLGLSRTTPLRYFQANLHPGDTLLLAAQPSPAWSAASLMGISGQGMESLRRRLFTKADLDLNAFVLQARPGRGQLHQVSARPSANPESVAVPLPPLPDLSPETLASLALEDIGLPARPAPGGAQAGQPAAANSAGAPPAPAPASTPFTEPGRSPASVSEPPLGAGLAPRVERSSEAGSSGAGVETRPGLDQPARRPARPRLDFSPIRQFFAALVLGLNRSFKSLFSGTRIAAGRMMPEESMAGLPPALKGFIAIAVPVVVVSVASVVYLQRGLAAEYQVWFNQAQEAASLAVSQPDQSMRRVVWETALQYLDQAESYQRTEESEDLRAEALLALDEINLVKRLNYQEAVIGGLPDAVNISRLALSNDDLYMLDAHSGVVLRGRVTNSHDYEIDRSFQCGPGEAGSYLVGSIVDIAEPPLGSDPEVVLIAMDTNGSLLYCYTNRPPETYTLTEPGTTVNWGSLVSFTLDPDLGHFYLLDPVNQAVWAYWGSHFDQQPSFYFGNDVPNLTDAIELAVDQRDLYILQSGGAMTLCTYSEMAVAPTRCAESVPYIDTRAGQVGARMEVPGGFSQVLVSQPPDPSLYLLAPQQQAIYRFNLRTLNYHRQFMPAGTLAPGEATAFTLNNLQRIVYLAVGNHVYQASIP